jgi:hypothetical protein
MKWICIMASAVAMTTFAGIAEAAISDCPAPRGVVEVVLPSGLPAILRDQIGDVALPGEPFDSTDVYVKGHKHRRYIFAWNIGGRWIVATEQGGITLRSAIFVYDLGKDGKTVS